MFNIELTTQIAAYILYKRGGLMHYLKLMKLMYLTEQQYLLKYGEYLTGDKFVSMNNGPVLSGTYSLLKDGAEVWDHWIKGEEDWQVSLKVKDIDPKDPLETFDLLSPAIIKVIDSVYEKYGSYNRWALCDLTHTPEVCPEWKNPHGSALPIQYEDILRCNGVDPERTKAIIARIKELESLQSSSATME